MERNMLYFKRCTIACSEELYEQKVIQIVEKLGWSRFKKEIILRKSYQLGSVGTIIPDIIIKSLNTDESFVIEIKRPSININNKSHKMQLFSYMRQLKLEYGLLIGNKIQIYYDGQLKTENSPILIKSIEISDNNKDNLLLINLFQKQSFSYQNLNAFVEKELARITFENHKEELYNILISNDYKEQIKQLIVNNLEKNWDKEIINNTLDQLSISIKAKDNYNNSDLNIITETIHDNTKNDIKIGQLVKNNLNKIASFCELNNDELLNLLSKKYSKETFGINYPFMQEVNDNMPIPKKHYWKNPKFKLKINNKYYVFTCEWIEKNRQQFKNYLNFKISHK
jgi:hypothetical protein